VSATASRPNDFSFEYWLSRGSIEGVHAWTRDAAGGVGEEQVIEVRQERLDLLLQLDDFIDAIDSGRRPMNSLEQARLNFCTLRAVERSISVGTEVALP
jgi:hypothetical protein